MSDFQTAAWLAGLFLITWGTSFPVAIWLIARA